MATNPTATIVFEGEPLSCRAGTSIAVALWERGIRVLSHSPKYGRPRGLHCGRGHCTSCLMRVDGVPNVRTCLEPVREGMRLERQDAGMALGRPLQRMLDLGDALVPGGFYYKWFTRPAALSRFFLRRLRPMTGIGRLPDPDAWFRTDASATADEEGRDLGWFDDVIIGAGPSGLAAAARTVGRTLLVDDGVEAGGQRGPALRLAAASLGPDLAGLAVLARAHRRLAAALAGLPGIPRLRTAWRTRAVGAYHPDTLLLRDERGLAFLRARRLHWTAGALDRLGLFPGNDVPGLLGPRALYRLIGRDGMQVRGRQVLVAGTGQDLWLSAALLHAVGARPTVVVSEAGWPQEVGAAATLGWRLHTGLSVTSARTNGGVRVALECAPEQDGQQSISVTGELAVICAPGKPAYDIPYQLGADLELRPEHGGYLLRTVDGSRGEAVLEGGLRLDVAGEAAGASPDRPDADLPQDVS